MAPRVSAAWSARELSSEAVSEARGAPEPGDVVWLHPLSSRGGRGQGPGGLLSALSCDCRRRDRDTEPALFIVSKWFFPVFCSSEVLKVTSWILQFA